MWNQVGGCCRAELVPAFVRLLRDVEAEVRVAAAGKVAAFCKLLGQDQVCVWLGNKQDHDSWNDGARIVQNCL